MSNMLFYKNQLFILLFAIFMIFSCGCNRHIKEISSENVVFYPPAPDTARLQYLTSISNSSQVIKERKGLAKIFWGTPPIWKIVKPYGIATKANKIYICDAGYRGIIIIDLEKNGFEIFTPRGKGQMKLPINCILDDDGFLYVADVERKQVIVFDNSLNYITAIGDPENFKPSDVCINDSLIFISDLNGHRINVYNKYTYDKLYDFPDAEKGTTEFLYTATNIFLTDSSLYVSDMGDAKVKVYTHEGSFVNSFGSYGRNIGQFVRIKGIAVDKETNIYAVDAGFENVQIFNKKGQLLMFFGGPYKGPGDMWLPAKVAIDYHNLEYFQKYVDPEYQLEYIVFVTNQYGHDKIGVYGFIKQRSIVK